MDRSRSHLASLLVACALIAAAPATGWSAKPPTQVELNKARERFAEGRKLEEAGQFAQALLMFQQVAQVKTTPQVRFHIALCLMHTDKPVEALDEFHTAIVEAGTSAPNVVVEAKQHIATLEKQVATVTVNVPGNEAKDAVVTVDGHVVTPDVPFYLQPGPHHLTLVRSGQTSAERSVTVSVGERARFELTDASQPTNGRRVASMVAFSVAGVSLLGLGAFALLRADRLAKLEAACPNLTGCDRSLEPVVRDGKTYSAAMNVFAGLAAAASVTGTVLYATSLSSSTPRSAARVDLRMHPMVGPGIGFVVLEAKF